MGESALRRTLNKMQVSLIEREVKQYYLRSNSYKMTEKLIKTFTLSKISNLTPKSTISNYL